MMNKYILFGLAGMLAVSLPVFAEDTDVQPRVELRLNGSQGVVYATYGSTALLSWNTAGVKTCTASTDTATDLSGSKWKGKLSLNGTKAIVLTKKKYTNTAFVFGIECTKANGQKIRDEVRVVADPLRFIYPAGGEQLTAGTDVLVRHVPTQIKSTEYRLKNETGDTYKLKGRYTSDGFLWEKAHYYVGSKERGLVPDGRYSLVLQMTSTKQVIDRTSTFIAYTNPSMRKPEGLMVDQKKLFWTTISEAWGYDVYRNTVMDSNIITRPCTSIKPYTSYGCYATQKGVASQVSVSSLKKGVSYYYKIRSKNVYGEVSEWSAWKEVKL